MTRNNISKVISIVTLAPASMLYSTSIPAATVRSALPICVTESLHQIMNKLQQLSHSVAWEHPNPARHQVGRKLVKEGAILPNSLTEDIMGFSLCPEYSKKQLRRIARLKIEKAKYGHGRSNIKVNVIRGLKTAVQYRYANTANRGLLL
jgi:hypothetical protein